MPSIKDTMLTAGNVAPKTIDATNPTDALGNTQPHSHGTTVLRNFASLSASAVFSRLAGLATNAILARRISTSGFGITGIAQSVTTYFSLLSDLGLGTVAVREGAQNPEKLQQVVSSMLGLRLALTAVSVPLGLLVAQYLPYSEASRNLFRIYLLTLPIQALGVDWVFRAVQKMHLNTVLQLVGVSTTLVLTLTLIREPSHVFRVAGIAALSSTVTVLVGIRLLRREGLRFRPTFCVPQAKYFLMQSIPLCATSVAITLYSQANNLILGAARGDADVGLYVAATRLSQVCYYPIWLYFSALGPALMQTWASSQEGARSMLATSVRFTTFTSIGCGLLATSAGPWVLVRIFGKAFSDSGQAFELLVWTGVIIAIGHNWGQLSIAAKKNRLLLQSTFLGALVNLAVCAATVTQMGIRGAALSNMLAEIAVHAVMIASFGWYLGFSVLREALKSIMAGAGAYGVSVVTRGYNPAICALFTGTAFLVLSYLLGAVTLGDVLRLKRMASQRGRPHRL